MVGQVRLPKLLAAGCLALAAEKPCEAMDLEKPGLMLLVAGFALIAVGAALIPKLWARIGAALIVVAIGCGAYLYLVSDRSEALASVMPLAAVAGVAAIVYARGPEWAPYAGLAALGQLLVLPPPPIAELQLARWNDLMLAHHGVLGTVVQLAVGLALVAQGQAVSSEKSPEAPATPSTITK